MEEKPLQKSRYGTVIGRRMNEEAKERLRLAWLRRKERNKRNKKARKPHYYK